MSSKKIIILLIFLIAVITAGFFFYKDKDLVKVALAPTQTGPVTLQDKQITDNTKPFIIKINYPYIEGLADFNSKVDSIINKEINDFKENSLANDQAVKDTDPENYAKYPREYELDISYTKGQVDENIVSIIFNVYNFEGGAHGASYFVPLNYNIKGPKGYPTEVKLSDLFPNDKNYLKTISDFCIADLTAQLTKSLGNLDGTWVQDGAGPSADNFQFFLINPSTSSGQATITFYFPQYQIAFGAAGDFKVVMPK